MMFNDVLQKYPLLGWSIMQLKRHNGCLILNLCLFVLCFSNLTLAAGEAASEPVAAMTSEEHTLPKVNHAMLTLSDGRVLVAGGMPAFDFQPEKAIEGNSEIWDPKTGQWQPLGHDFKFDYNQKVLVNNLGEGEVLFFAIREDGDRAEYQARTWNLQNNKVENLTVTVKPKVDSDIAVLADGRVLMVNGAAGSVDIWDSSTDKLVENEIAEIENSRWRILPLKNKNVLFVQRFPARTNNTKRGGKQSSVVRWNSVADEWTLLEKLPMLFHDGGVLTEKENGEIYVEDGDVTARLPGDSAHWISSTSVGQKEGVGGNVGITSLAAASSPSPQIAGTDGGKTVQSVLEVLGLNGDTNQLVWLIVAYLVMLVMAVIIVYDSWKFAISLLRRKTENIALLARFKQIGRIVLMVGIAITYSFILYSKVATL